MMSSLGAKASQIFSKLLIVDVDLRFVFFLFLLFFFPIVCLILPSEMSEMIAFFVPSTKTTQPLPQVFLINVQKSATFLHL